MTIKQKLAIYLARQKPMLVYTNGKEYIGIEERTNRIGDKQYIQWCKTDISNAYDFSGFMFILFKRKLIKTLSITINFKSDWHFTKIQFIKKGDII